MPNIRPLRIVIADDHEIFRIGIRASIDAQSDMRVVGEAGDGKAACRAVRALQDPFGQGVDVVVMDISMPVWNGVHATTILRRFWPDVRVIALSEHPERQYRCAMQEAGASGYVLKSSASARLLEGIRLVAVGHTYFDCDPPPTPAREEVARDKESISNRQEEVLRLIVQGYMHKEIAAKIRLSVKTIETHKCLGMSRLGITTRRDLTAYAAIQGWLDEMP